MWTVVAVAMVLLLVGGGLLAYWKRSDLVRMFRADDVSALAEQAREYHDKGEMEAASEVLRQAFKIDSRHPELNRVAVEVIGESNPKEAMIILRGMRARGDADLEDEVALLELLVRDKRLQEAAQVRDRLLSESPDHSEVNYWAARLSEEEGELGEFERLVRRAIELDANNREARLALAAHQIGASTPGTAEQGWAAIADLADSPDELGLRALLLIKERGKLKVADQERYLELFKQHPLRGAETAESEPVIEVLEWELAIRPLEEEEIVEDALERWSTLPDVELNDRLSWLNLNGYGRYVERFSRESLEPSNPAFLASAMETAVMSGDLEAAKERLNAAAAAGEAEEKIAFGRALLAIEAGESEEEIAHAFSVASSIAINNGKPNMVVRAGKSALELKQYQAAEVVYRSLMEVSPEVSHRGLAEVAEAKEDFDGLLDHLEALARLNPGDYEMQKRTAYFQLLLNRRLDTVRMTTNRLEAMLPEDSFVALLAAFAQYRAGSYERARARCEGIDPEKLEAGPRAVMAVILRFGGDQAGAEALVEGIGLDDLGLLERELLAQTSLGDGAGGSRAVE
ncbi:MAG: tetratricopeptide repeat protein [Verrucomicrobiota bacterium]